MKVTYSGAHIIRTKDGRKWAVIMERLKNTNAGAPRYRATITEIKEDNEQWQIATHLKFIGHFWDEKSEAEFAISEMYKQTEKWERI